MARQIALLICSLLAMAGCNPIDVDCTRRQDFNVVKDCCAYPTLRFYQFKGQCGKYMPVGAPRISPCLYECIFNKTNTVVDGAIHPGNAQLMLEKLFGNQDFEEAYFNGLMGCSDSVQEMLSNRRPRPQGRTEQCSPFSLFYALCAQRYVFDHCPSSSWSGTESCEVARLQNMNCSKPTRGSSNRLP